VALVHMPQSRFVYSLKPGDFIFEIPGFFMHFFRRVVYSTKHLSFFILYFLSPPQGSRFLRHP
jgi:hypothetical protein